MAKFEDLEDVTISNPKDGDVVKYTATGGKTVLTPLVVVRVVTLVENLTVIFKMIKQMVLLNRGLGK